jgi:hypothetical protein
MRLKHLLVLGILAVAAAVLLVPTVGQAAAGPAALAWSQGGTTVTSYDYGTLDPAGGDTSESVTFALSYSGKRAFGRLVVGLSGSSAFSITSNSCSGKRLGGRKSCSLTVEYAPSGAGASDSATLTATGEHGAAASLSLTGASKAAKTQSQINCESYGGTFVNPSADAGGIWDCDGWTYTGGFSGSDFLAKLSTLTIDCAIDGGGHLLTVTDLGTANSTCVKS